MKVAMKYKLELRFKLLSYLQEYSKKKGQEMTFLTKQKCKEHARYHNVSKTEHGKVGVAHGSILQKVLELVQAPCTVRTNICIYAVETGG